VSLWRREYRHLGSVNGTGVGTYSVGAGQGVLGLDANGQQACTTLLLSMVTAASWPVSWLGLVSPSVPTQYPQTNPELEALADSGTIAP